MTDMKVVLVTGLSGSGKSVAIRALEDSHFYCVDNLPPSFIPQVIQRLSSEGISQIAIAADARISLEALDYRDGRLELVLQAADVAARITPRTRVLFLNSPHNPTGAVLRPEDIAALGALAIKHDLWIVSDEVYEELVFDGTRFASPFDNPDLAERTVVTASISKSHAAPGFRSGWCVGSPAFCAQLLPLAETMLFGNQPFVQKNFKLVILAIIILSVLPIVVEFIREWRKSRQKA